MKFRRLAPVTAVSLLCWAVCSVTGVSVSSHFRRLKLGADAVDVARPSSTNSGAGVDKCCERQQRKRFIGYGLDGEQLFVDEGQCRQMCPTKKKKIHRREFENYLQANRSVDPIQLFLSLQKEASPESCGGTSSCQPTRSVMERHMTMSGPRQVSVIEDCLCTPQPPHCQRVVDNVVYFADTPFETVVDVGTCQGPCRSDGETRCRSVHNKTVAIAGPNGDICVEVIERCGCTPSCYRASLLEYVHDYTVSPVSSQEEEGNDDDDEELEESLDHQPLIKVIDVGRCVGVCDAPSNKQHCVMRDDASKCLMALTRPTSSCVPLGFKLHRYRTKAGSDKNVLAITECGCQ